MQGWTGCSSLATPTGTGFTQGPTLIDMRDNKQYEIRKFADGKCWMVDNLMYGGDTDACNGESTFAGNGSAIPSNQFGPGTYGDCIDPRTSGGAPCITGSKVCGYLYNWQAVMQHSSAYYGVTYTGPTTNIQGLCPDGWRMASGNTSGEFYQLHLAVGSPTTGFWQPGGNWKGVFSGAANGYQGSHGFWHSSTSRDSASIYNFWFTASGVTSGNSAYAYVDSKRRGFSIRCLKD